MKTPNYSNLFQLIFFTSVLFCTISCSSKNNTLQTSDYDKLCKIYEGIVRQPIELGIKEMKIIEMVQKQLPSFFNDNFIHISKADSNQRYQFIKQLAEEENKDTWDCEIMKFYYANEFNEPVS